MVQPEGAQDVRIDDLAPAERDLARPVLDASFTGWYRRHADHTLRRVDRVRAIRSGDRVVGVAFLELLEPGLGYVYYVAVHPENRRAGFGARLLRDALDRLAGRGAIEVYAAVEEDNPASLGLFHAHGFREVSRAELDRRFGRFHAARLRYRMTLVPGELLLRTELGKTTPLPPSAPPR